MNAEPLHFQPDHELYTGRVQWRVWLLLQKGERIEALRIIRRWYVEAGLGDSYTKAVNFLNDVIEERPWVLSQMNKTQPVAREHGERVKKVFAILRRVKKAKSRRYLRLLRGQFETLLSHLSIPLRDSAMREFHRIAPNPDRY